MSRFGSPADVLAEARHMTWAERELPQTLHGLLARAAERHPDRPAVSFQMFSSPSARAETRTWAELHRDACRAANLFRRLGIGETDVVAFLLPNCSEVVTTLLGAAIAGVVNPINPLLESSQIAALLRETGAKVVVTLKAMPKTDVAQKAAEAVAHAPDVKTVLEVDLLDYLTPPKSWIARLIRPKVPVHHTAKVLNFRRECAREPEVLTFPDAQGDRVAALFHTGGTTGRPKVAQHRYRGMIYNGWIGQWAQFTERDVIMCPLPMFHVFAAYPILMSAISSGAHVILPTPGGYRGEGVFDNFWKLIERWQVSFLITVPTALSALMQRKVDADISSLKTAISGSAPMPVELFQRFAAATNVQVSEGYGLTEATCLVSCNPFAGMKKVGSVGIPFPYSDVKILRIAEDGSYEEMGTDQIGEICVSSPGVSPGSTYREGALNGASMFVDGKYLRTGDLGRIDVDGYLWITGRAKDVIIRGGHNIDPAVIEESLMAHPDVAFAGAIGQPDAHAGEMPCVYVELVNGGSVTSEALAAFARERITERAAQPKYVEILPELPKTVVGKILKNELRKRAIRRVFNAELSAAGISTLVHSVVEDKRRGLLAQIDVHEGSAEQDAINAVLSRYAVGWQAAAPQPEPEE